VLVRAEKTPLSKEEAVALKLTENIEEYLQLVVREAPDFFKHEGVSLERAIGRAIYIKANKGDLNYLLGLDEKAAGSLTQFSERLPAVMRGHSLFFATIPHFALSLLYQARRLCRSLWFNWQVNQSNQDICVDSTDILFAAIDPSFVDYLAPIYEPLASRASFFPMTYSDCANIIKSKKYRRVRYVAAKPRECPADKSDDGRFGVITEIKKEMAYWYDCVSRILQRSRPRCVVFAEGTSALDECIRLAAEKLSIPTVRIQYGRAGYLYYAYRDMGFNYMLMWGEGFSERLRAKNPRSEFITVGSHSLDNVLDSNYPTRIQTFKGQGPLVLVFTQPLRHLGEDYHHKLAVAVGELLKLHPTCRVLIRKHPKDQSTYLDQYFQNEEKVWMTQSHDFRLGEVMKTADVALGFFSTALSECVAAGVIPVMMKLMNHASIFPHPGQYGAAIMVDTPQEAASQILELLNHPDQVDTYEVAMCTFKELFFYQTDGRATERIVDFIQNLVNDQYKSKKASK